MKRNWQQILLAVILGIMLPSMTLRFGSKMIHPQPENTEPQQSLPQLQQTQQTQPPELMQIPVLSEGAVTMMELDTYLVGVVLAEMPASFETEALKAQAVVARTYALKRYEEGVRHPQGAVCTDHTCCQAYISVADYLEKRGNQADVNKITQAVLATTGQVLTYQGKLAEATYFSCSGGRTEDAAAVWGSDIPYLQAVDSPGEEAASAYTETVCFTQKEFADALDRNLTGSAKSWLGTVTWSEGGGVATMMIAGKSYTGVQLRKLLGLNSTAFTMKAEGASIAVTTKGKGHRVGMSQYGADAMAVTGSTFEQILMHYYPGTVIDKIDTLG
ncbi:MAG: stage II sporulation protein D [Oscillospiraceae bacterium]|nr:stage II sporulation protein D [Oscillospiraceae bacterium]